MNLTISEILQNFKDEYSLTIEQVSTILEWTTRTYSNYKNGSSDGTNVRQIQHVKRKIEAVKDYFAQHPKGSIDEYIEQLNSPSKTTENTTSDSTMKTLESQQSTIHMLVKQQQKLIDQHQQLIDKLLSCNVALPFGVGAKTKTAKTAGV